MPVIGSDTEQHASPTGNYGYSAAKMEDLGASEYTLVTIVCDASHSVSTFKDDLEATLAKIVEACKKHPRSDNLMIRLVQFGTQNQSSRIKDIHEIHGFKLLSQIGDDDYDGCINLGVFTPLYDGVENSVAATSDWARQLDENDFTVNAVIYILTDGRENRSQSGIGEVCESLQKAMTDEDAPLESLITILIGVNIEDTIVSDDLSRFKDEAGLTQFIEVKKADAKTLAKLGDFISHSISAISTSLGTGTPSQPVSLTI